MHEGVDELLEDMNSILLGVVYHGNGMGMWRRMRILEGLRDARMDAAGGFENILCFAEHGAGRSKGGMGWPHEEGRYGSAVSALAGASIFPASLSQRFSSSGLMYALVDTSREEGSIIP